MEKENKLFVITQAQIPDAVRRMASKHHDCLVKHYNHSDRFNSAVWEVSFPNGQFFRSALPSRMEHESEEALLHEIDEMLGGYEFRDVINAVMKEWNGKGIPLVGSSRLVHNLEKYCPDEWKTSIARRVSGDTMAGCDAMTYLHLRLLNAMDLRLSNPIIDVEAAYLPESRYQL